MDAPEAFFLPAAGGRYAATAAAQGPWEPGAMHGGPPTALLATLLTEHAVTLSPTLRLARISVDFLGSLPVAELATTVRVIRPGRRIALLEASLAVGGRTVATARGWFIDAAGAVAPVRHVPDATVDGEIAPFRRPPPLPEPPQESYFSAVGEFGYAQASEWRATSGSFSAPGPAGVWSRVLLPLIAGRPLTGVARMLILADAANGVSGELPWGEWLFIPPGITVTLLREPVGEWVHLAARTTLGEDGIGLTYGRLSDEHGGIAVVSQPLLVARR